LDGEGEERERKRRRKRARESTLQKRKELWRSTGAESFPPEKLI